MTASDRFTELNDADRQNIQRVDDVLAMLLQSITHARSLLAVALEPGGNSVRYAKRLGALQPVISRHLLEMGFEASNGGPGLGLIDRDPDPADRNFLTSPGRKLIGAVATVLDPK
jgi:hypothetical protein